MDYSVASIAVAFGLSAVCLIGGAQYDCIKAVTKVCQCGIWACILFRYLDLNTPVYPARHILLLAFILVVTGNLSLRYTSKIRVRSSFNASANELNSSKSEHSQNRLHEIDDPVPSVEKNTEMLREIEDHVAHHTRNGDLNRSVTNNYSAIKKATSSSTNYSDDSERQNDKKWNELMPGLFVQCDVCSKRFIVTPESQNEVGGGFLCTRHKSMVRPRDSTSPEGGVPLF